MSANLKEWKIYQNYINEHKEILYKIDNSNLQLTPEEKHILEQREKLYKDFMNADLMDAIEQDYYNDNI